MLTAQAVATNGAVDQHAASATTRLGMAWREMRRGAATGVLVERLFGRAGAADFVEPGHLDVLDILIEHDGSRMSDLALALHVDPSTVTRTMHRMEAAGLARRAAVESDGRVVTAHLTAEGRRLHALVAARRAALIDAALEDFTPAERDHLVALLERFLLAINRTATDSADAAG